MNEKNKEKERKRERVSERERWKQGKQRPGEVLKSGETEKKRSKIQHWERAS